MQARTVVAAALQRRNTPPASGRALALLTALLVVALASLVGCASADSAPAQTPVDARNHRPAPQHQGSVRGSGPTSAGGAAGAVRGPLAGAPAVRFQSESVVSREVAGQVYAVQRSGEARSPSEAGATAPQKSRPLLAKPGVSTDLAGNKKLAADRDNDGIVDESDVAPKDERLAQNIPEPPAPPPGVPTPTPPAGPKPQQPAPGPRDGSMIIYTAKLTLAVYQVEAALNVVERIAKDQGGFLATRADRSITIRVPREKFESTVAAIEKTGDVLHRDVQAQDVTEEFVDLEIRIKNARAMRERLTKLLEKAPVKEALEIEKELGRVTEELERLEGRLKLLRDRIAYSTITVEYNGRGATIQQTSIRLPFPWLGALGLPSLLRLHEER